MAIHQGIGFCEWNEITLTREISMAYIGLEALVNRLLNEATNGSEKERLRLHHFSVIKKAKELIAPCRKQMDHHREREKFYTTELENSEKELREKGVNMEAFDPNKGYGTPFSNMPIASGNVSNAGVIFRPQIDQRLMDVVNRNKSKMLEHRDEAVKFEKYLMAFSCNPNETLRLDVNEIWMFKLPPNEA